MSESPRRPSVKGKRRASARRTEKSPASSAAPDSTTRIDPKNDVSRGTRAPERDAKAAAAASTSGKTAAQPEAPAANAPADTPDASVGKGNPAGARPPVQNRRSISKTGGLDASFLESDEAFFSRALPTDQASAAESKAAAAKEEGAKPSASLLIRETNWKKVTLITLAVLAFVAIIAGAGFVWQTFFRYDDAADIQGEWITDDGSMTVVIDDGSINMPNNLPYAYALDTWNKTISFDFQGLSGSGTYTFSADRQHLVITEQDGETSVATKLSRLSDDSSAKAKIVNGAAALPSPPEAEGEDSGDAASSSDEGEGAGSEGADSSLDSIDSSATVTLAGGVRSASNGAMLPPSGAGAEEHE